MDRFQLSAFYTMPHGLWRDALPLRRIAHRDIAGRRPAHQERTQCGRDKDSPGSAWGEPLADNRSVVQPTNDARSPWKLPAIVPLRIP